MRVVDSTEQHEFRTGLREWLRAVIPPAPGLRPRQWDAEALRAWSKSLHEAGYAGITWPVGYGGRGLSPVYQGIYAEESTLLEAPDHINVIGLGMVGPTIIGYGTARQQAQHLPKILSGETIFCQGFSEPAAGSDLAGVRTRAVPVAGGYQLHGEKVWSSYAHLADWCLVLARTDPQAAKHRGLTCFLLDLSGKGVQVSPIRQMSGDSSFSQIALTGAFVPDSCVLGEVGDGWRVALRTLAHERGTFGITLTARLAVQFDRLRQTASALGLDTDPLWRREIAALYVTLQGLRYTGYRVLAALERTGEPGPEASILKLRWAHTNQRLTELAWRMLGNRAGAFWDGYWQGQRLRARTNSIEGGTSEILRGIVAERVLLLPRSR